MRNINLSLIAVFGGLFIASTAVAQFSVLSDKFQGDEEALFILDEHADLCSGDGPGPLIHREVGPIRVKQDGTYWVRDAGWWPATDTVTSWHEGPVDPDDPEANLVGWVDDVGAIQLESGVDYYVVAQPFCWDITGFRGLWGIAIDGPGEATGDQVVAAESHWEGNWDNTGDLLDVAPRDFDCEDRFYTATGPHQVDRAGSYWLSAVSALPPNYDTEVFLAVYDQEFDPDQPRRHQVGWAWNGGPLTPPDFGPPTELEAGKDYWFVAQPGCELDTGQYQYVLYPSNLPVLNQFLSGFYYDRMTPGAGRSWEFHPPPQGDFGGSGFVFGAMYTWTDEPPQANVQAQSPGTSTQAVGDPRQRWLTMQGFFEFGVRSMELGIYNATGGVFNDPTPVDNTKVGTATLDMESCRKYVLNYSLDSGESGSMVDERVLDENVEPCKFFNFGPDVLYDQD